MNVHLLNLSRALTQAWCAATSYDPAGWTRENPAWGQCAVTACVVQDYLGGDILWGEVVLPDGEKVSHFFNRVAGGMGLDLTASQFPADAQKPAGGPPPDGQDARTHILSYPQTRARYEELARRVQVALLGGK